MVYLTVIGHRKLITAFFCYFRCPLTHASQQCCINLFYIDTMSYTVVRNKHSCSCSCSCSCRVTCMSAAGVSPSYLFTVWMLAAFVCPSAACLSPVCPPPTQRTLYYAQLCLQKQKISVFIAAHCSAGQCRFLKRPYDMNIPLRREEGPKWF